MYLSPIALEKWSSNKVMTLVSFLLGNTVINCNHLGPWPFLEVWKETLSFFGISYNNVKRFLHLGTADILG
jgi:hypothetical protein